MYKTDNSNHLNTFVHLSAYSSTKKLLVSEVNQHAVEQIIYAIGRHLSGFLFPRPPVVSG